MSAASRCVQWSADAAPISTASCTPGPCESWLACTRSPRPRRPAACRIGAGRLWREGALLAEHVAPAGFGRTGVEHGAGDEGDVVILPSPVLRRHDVRPEKGHLLDHLAGDVQAALLVYDGEPVAGLRLERRRALRLGLGDKA